MPKKNDFIIVGGGLVGCLASLILSKKNYIICLVEMLPRAPRVLLSVLGVAYIHIFRVK